jgi:hypothetical protein
MRYGLHRPKTITPLRSTSLPSKKKNLGTTTIESANGKRPKFDPFARKKRNAFVPRIKEDAGPMTEEQAASFYRPNYFIDPTMIRTAVEAVTTKKIEVAELPAMYGLAYEIATVQGRIHVTRTDLEGAIEIRTQERLEAIANGTGHMGEMNSVLPAPRKVHEIRWKQICKAILDFRNGPKK